MSAVPELACPAGVDILRGLAFGGVVIRFDGEWRFITAIAPGWTAFDGCRLQPSAIADHDVEWCLEDGFARRMEMGRKLEITRSGRNFIRAIDDDYWKVVREMDPPKIFSDMAREAKKHFPEDHLGRCYVVSGWICMGFLGVPWTEAHVMSDSAPTNFFRNSKSKERWIGSLRATHLAEMLVNLRHVGGFDKVIKMIKEGDIEAGFAELEVGKLLAINSRQFRFNVPSGIKGKDFDLEIKFGDITACADTKCKVEDTERSKKTLLHSLHAAQKQLPGDRPSIIFVKLPQTWNPDGQDDSHLSAMQEVCDEFFRGTGRVVSVVFYFSLALDFAENQSGAIYVAREINNPNHRFDKQVNWEVMSSFDHLPPHWFDLVKMCA